jgi:hypothetical protein
MQRSPAVGAVLLALALALLLAGAEVPAGVAAERANVRRVAAAIAAARSQPTATPYPTPAAVPATARTRAEILAGLPMGDGPNRCRSAEVKLMRRGDWWRLDGGRLVADGADDWVWAAACWGDDFEPFGQRLRGVRYTWEVHVWPAGGAADGLATREEAFEPPLWRDLPDYSAASQP